MKKLAWTTEQWALGASLGVLLLAVALVAGWVFDKHLWAEARLSELEPRYARLLGLEQQKDKLALGAEQGKAIVARYVYQGMDATQAGNDAQRRARDMFAKAGLEVMSSQVLPPKADRQFERIPVVIRFEGSLSALQGGLVALGDAGQGPAILVEGFNIQTIGFVKAEVAQRLGGQVNLYVLRGQS